MIRSLIMRGCLAIVAIQGLASLCWAKGSHETGRIRCNKRGCFDLTSTLDPAKVIACADKVGASYNFVYHHYDGTPKVVAAWRACMGLAPFTGPDPQRMACAKQSGAIYNPKTWHFEGSSDVMAHFRECMGF